MPTRVAVLAALFTYVEFVPVTTVGELASALTTAVGVGMIAYTGLKNM